MDIQEIADRIAIRDVTERYSLCVTRRDWADMAECFHAESRWQVAAPFDLEFLGRDGIREGISAAVGGSDFLVQMTHSAVINSLTADRATQDVVINETGRTSATQRGFNLFGVYSDTLTKIDGRWRFEQRVFRPHYFDTNWLPGTMTVDYTKVP